MRPYLLGSGFFGGAKEREFMDLWAKTLVKNTSVKPADIAILSVGDSYLNEPALDHFHRAWGIFPEKVRLQNNLGHVGQLMSGNKPQQLCGWSGALLWLCMTAYNAEMDCCFVEQDVLAFGDWFGQMMKDMGEGSMVWGHKHTSEPHMRGSNSIVYIRHEFLLPFIQNYIALGSESDPDLIPETKFYRIELLFPDKVKRLSYPCDRERPIPWDLPIFYAQKLLDEELTEAKRRKLL